MKVLKLLRPGFHRHMTLSGLSKKEGSIQLLVKSADKSPSYKTEAIAETTAEMDGTADKTEERPVTAVADACVDTCETATLCGEA